MELVSKLYVPDDMEDTRTAGLEASAVGGWYELAELDGVTPRGEPTAEFVEDAHPIPHTGHARAWVVRGEVMPPGHNPG